MAIHEVKYLFITVPKRFPDICLAGPEPFEINPLVQLGC